MTIKEIAKLANVSLGTVDRVLHKRGKVSKETEERILAIIKKANYKPNMYARGLVLNKTYHIVAIIPSFKAGEYWEMPTQGILAAEKNLSQFGIKLTLLKFDQNSATSFEEKAKELLELKPDGVILAPVINFEAVKLTEKLKAANIPFNLIDSNLPDSGALSFIGQDAFQSGKLAAKLLCSETQKKGTIAIISVKKNENHNKTLQRRIEGFKDYLYTSKLINDITIVESNIHLSKNDWKKRLKEACNPNNDTIGVFVPSSLVHYVALHFTEDPQYFSKIKLVGNDLIPNNIKYLRSGVISYLIGQRPQTQGYLAMQNFYNHLILKQTPEEKRFLPLDIITQENLIYYDIEFSNIFNLA
ncbi:LacI family DNA-binding transcriptional regulator [Galbibacter mesophilus]|uniref:LacI family DNA-binding transcriptional regulator n=1 Tax=Galbibacter mesophilus TaxID=379069 RepID=UPI00191DB2D3|nr:LacI family DNA-binding transcriptional regulator [Galbibacter mesophilus]MCM5663100.1 LacI family DNA-binding transcriptional regulator [Galbibacter mesophilus]